MRTIAQVVALMDGWFETMRSSEGYTGPVVHWWQNCLLYTGVGLDWRYEGIIDAYLTLYKKTSESVWLDKAIRAGEDLVRGQLPNGNYRNSAFELNPYTGGTPHEAAADIGLLLLAEQLKLLGNTRWQVYLEAAQRNIDSYTIRALWDARMGYFRDIPEVESFVPNKAATLSEALFKLALLTGDDHYLELYAVPTLRTLLRYQVRGGALDGAIAQNMLHGNVIAKYFPYYVARCVPALLLAHTYTGEEQFAEAARRAIQFVFRQQTPNGGFVQVVYANGRRNLYQQWVAAVGDIVRIANMVADVEVDRPVSHDWLLAGLQPTGGMNTALGFNAQISQRLRGETPDFRDLLPVCGWADKAFRYFVSILPEGEAIPAVVPQALEATCTYRGRRLSIKRTDQRSG